MDESPVQAEWRRWLDDHAPRFLLFARQKARCEADAQDLVQEAVMEAAQRTANDAPPPVALVYATIHRRAIDWARAKIGGRDAKAPLTTKRRVHGSIRMLSSESGRI